MKFYNAWFWTVWGIGAIISAVYFGWQWNERRKRGPVFPATLTEPILYQEYFASGRSRKNLITRLGGANHCLRLIVTANELWITTYFPFTLFAAFYDLEHRILKKNIVAAREVYGLFGRRLIIEYRQEDGQPSEIELMPMRYQKFKQALEVVTIAA